MNWRKIKLSDELREELKSPLGEVITGSEENIYTKITQTIKRLNPVKVICIGDTVSRFFSKNRIKTNMIIVDNHEQREPCKYYNYNKKHQIKVINKAGYIERNAWDAIKKSIEIDDISIIVNGEEDLLLLAVTIIAPKGTLLCYGQPQEGIVAVNVTEKFKRYIKDVIKRMIIQ